MKHLFSILCVLFLPAILSAGTIYFDRTANLYVVPVTGNYRGTEKDNLSGISSKKYAGIRTLNVFIYDPQSKESRYVFDGSFQESITDILFESDYAANAKALTYNNESHITNNSGIAQRDLKSTILIVTYDEKSASSRMWRAQKKGAGAQVIHTFNDRTEWYFDTGNNRLIFITRTDGAVTVIEKEW